MGVVGDFVGNLTQRNVDKANAGTFAGRENRFFPREVELSLFGQIDPYARAEVRIEAGEEEPGAETGVSPGRGQPHAADAAVRHPGSSWARCATASATPTRSTSTTCRGSTGPTSCATSSARKGSPRRAFEATSCRTCRSTWRRSSASSTATTRRRSAAASSASRWSPAGCGRSSSWATSTRSSSASPGASGADAGPPAQHAGRRST